ncbi:MAG: YfhO family protein [Verrucomicrobiales bacterium]|nr:YfhO family protein [Verrucomicrobiales bacterium]
MIFLGDLLLGGKIFLARDALQDFLPARLFEAKSLLSGEFPFWNPYLGGGKPFIAEPQSQALYPVNILFLLFKPAVALNLYWLVHLYIGGLGAWFFCRQIKVSSSAACLAAISFMLGVWLLAQLEFPNNGAAGAWIPLIFGVLARFHAALPVAPRPFAECWRQRRLVGALSILFAVQFFANFPEFIIYPCVGYALYIGVAAVMGKSWRVAATLTLLFMVSGALALLMTLPETLSTAELVPYSERAGAFDTRFNMASMSLTHLLSAIFPFIGGFPGFPDKHWEAGLFEFWIGAFYAGAVPLMVMPFAFGRWSQKKVGEKIPALAAGAMILVGIALALGENTPLYPWLHAHAPLLGHFRFPAKFLILVVLGALMLAALGADALAKKRAASLPLLVTLGCVVAVSGLLALILWLEPAWCVDLTGAAGAQGSPLMLERAGKFAMVAWLFLALAFVWVLALAKTKINTAALLGAGALLTFINLLVISRQLHPAAPAADTLTLAVPPALERVAADRDYRAVSVYAGVQQYLYADPRPEIYRWAGHAGSGGMWAQLGIRQQYSALLKLQKYHQLTALIYGDNAALSNQALDLFGVKWLIVGEPWQRILWGNAGRDLKIAERPTALPRFKLYAAPTPVADDGEAWRRIISGQFTPDAPLVEPVCLRDGDITTVPLTMINAAPADADKLNVVAETSNKITLQTETLGARLLWFGDTWYPGWRAAVDGRATPIHRVNYMFMGVEIPAGKHTVAFKFYPRHFTVSLSVALVALGVSLTLLLARKNKSR